MNQREAAPAPASRQAGSSTSARIVPMPFQRGKSPTRWRTSRPRASTSHRMSRLAFMQSCIDASWCPASRTANGTPLPLSRDFAAKPRRVCRKTGSVMCAGHGASNETRLRSPRDRSRRAYRPPYGSRSGRTAQASRVRASCSRSRTRSGSPGHHPRSWSREALAACRRRFRTSERELRIRPRRRHGRTHVGLPLAVRQWPRRFAALLAGKRRTFGGS